MKLAKLTYITAMELLVALAMTQPSEARIVYTPTHVQVDSPYNLDLNHDGITDFTLYQHRVYGWCGKPRGIQDLLDETPAQGNGVVGSTIYGSGWAAALDRGVKIGSTQSFISDPVGFMASVASGYFWFGKGGCVDVHAMDGYWLNVSNRYLGLEFQIKGKTHYGWARLSVQVGYVYIHATLTGYAYETTAGKSIKAGQTKSAADEWDEEGVGTGASVSNPITDTRQPASLGMLALGAQSVPLWRRKESLACISENN
jgi:hypothetical protein